MPHEDLSGAYAQARFVAKVPKPDTTLCAERPHRMETDVPRIGNGEAQSAAANGKSARTETPARRLLTQDAADIVERPIDWEWRHRFVRGGLNLIEGHPESGKSSMLIDILARFSSGAALPDGAQYPPRRILILGAEDALESVVRPRLRVAGADLMTKGQIRFITGALSKDCKTPSRVVIPDDVPIIAGELASSDILYIDSSINDFAQRNVRPGDDMAIRELLGSVHEMARETNKTVIATRHGRKGGARDPLEFGSGTMGVIAKARAVFGVYRDPKDLDRRLFARVKSNLAPTVPTLACRFTDSDPDDPDSPLRVEWGEEDRRSATDILAEIHQAQRGSENDPSRTRRALTDWLSDGNWKSVEGIRELAEKSGLGWKSIEKAKREQGVISEHRPAVGWCWRDPYASTREEADTL